MSRRSLSPASPEETEAGARGKKRKAAAPALVSNTSLTAEAEGRTRDDTLSQTHLRPGVNLYLRRRSLERGRLFDVGPGTCLASSTQVYLDSAVALASLAGRK